jgi:hypothetical protein
MASRFINQHGYIAQPESRTLITRLFLANRGLPSITNSVEREVSYEGKSAKYHRLNIVCVFTY